MEVCHSNTIFDQKYLKEKQVRSIFIKGAMGLLLISLCLAVFSVPAFSQERDMCPLDRAILFAMESLELVSTDPDQNNEPYHGFYLEPGGSLHLEHALEIGVPHMTGRAVDALLYAENVSGRPLDPKVEAAIRKVLLDSFENKHHINSYIKDGTAYVEFHNLREGLSGLTALIQYRGDQQAAQDAQEMLEALKSITASDGIFSGELIAAQGKIPFYHGIGQGVTTIHSGRLVGALVKYYRVTQNPLAMELARKYALLALSNAFTEDGQLIGKSDEAGAGNHVHSITSALSSILLWALEAPKTDKVDDPNLLTNSGWDETSGSITLNNGFDTATCPGWQFFALPEGGVSTFTAKADPSAPSQPNLLEFTRASTTVATDSAVRKDSEKTTLLPGEMYEHGIWVRDIDGNSNQIQIFTGMFDQSGTYIGPIGEVNYRPTPEWTLVESLFVIPDNAVQGSFQFRIAEGTGSVQFDSAFLKRQDASGVAEKCKRVFDNGFKETLSSSWGWVKEERRPGTTRGEMNCSGDMLQAALFLGRLGYPEYYEVAERYMRGFMIPAQVVSVGSLRENPTAKEDKFKNIRHRAHGCYGFPMPNQRFDAEVTHAISALDVTAGVLQALCEFKRSIYTHENDAYCVNLWFDVDDPALHIESDLPEQGTLRVTPKAKVNLEVRIPSWVDVKKIQLTVGGKALPVTVMSGLYLQIPNVAGGEMVVVSIPLATRKTSETVFGLVYEVEWKGDMVTSLIPVGKDQPMYQADLPPTQVWGCVTDSATGAGVANGKVSLLNGAGEVLSSTGTDEGGNYAIDATISSGAYSLQVSLKDGPSQTFTDLAMKKGIPKTANFRLESGGLIFQQTEEGNR